MSRIELETKKNNIILLYQFYGSPSPKLIYTHHTRPCSGLRKTTRERVVILTR